MTTGDGETPLSAARIEYGLGHCIELFDDSTDILIELSRRYVQKPSPRGFNKIAVATVDHINCLNVSLGRLWQEDMSDAAKLRMTNTLIAAGEQKRLELFREWTGSSELKEAPIEILVRDGQDGSQVELDDEGLEDQSIEDAETLIQQLTTSYFSNLTTDLSILARHSEKGPRGLLLWAHREAVVFKDDHKSDLLKVAGGMALGALLVKARDRS